MSDTETHFSRHWYDVVAGDSLRQGDILRGAAGAWIASLPETEDSAPVVERARGDWIVATASCDLEQRTVSNVLLCQLLPASIKTLREKTDKDLAIRLEVLRRGLEITKFLLAESTDLTPEFPRSVVIFRTQVLLPATYIRSLCVGPRLRLKHPHRERFGAWIGGCFSRIGVEDDASIPKPDKTPFVAPVHVLRSDHD